MTLDTERSERRTLTDRLTAALAQARPRNRTPAMPEKDNQPSEAQLRPRLGSRPRLVANPETRLWARL